MRDNPSAAGGSADQSSSSKDCAGGNRSDDARASSRPGDGVSAVIDEHTFGQFESAMGDRGAVDAVLAMFLDDLPRLMDKVDESTAAGRLPEARAAAHRLKGNAGMIGALRLAAACRSFESAVEEDRRRELEGLAAAVAAEAELAAEAVRQRAPDSD